MSPDDRSLSHQTQEENQLPVDDLNPREVTPQSADAVKGGATAGSVPVSDIPVVKHTDSTTSKLF